jgi:hypothetical protein
MSSAPTIILAGPTVLSAREPGNLCDIERAAGLASAVRWLRKAHIAKHLGI